MSRFKNYGLWISLFSLIGILFKDSIPSNFQEIITVILSILVGLGIISNPKEGTGYIDK